MRGETISAIGIILAIVVVIQVFRGRTAAIIIGGGIALWTFGAVMGWHR